MVCEGHTLASERPNRRMHAVAAKSLSPTAPRTPATGDLFSGIGYSHANLNNMVIHVNLPICDSNCIAGRTENSGRDVTFPRLSTAWFRSTASLVFSWSGRCLTVLKCLFLDVSPLDKLLILHHLKSRSAHAGTPALGPDTVGPAAAVTASCSQCFNAEATAATGSVWAGSEH